METLHKLYLTRFSLVAGAIFVAIPFVEFDKGALNALFGGLLDLTTRSETFWAICFAYLLSWSAVIAFRITMLYGPERCGLPKNDSERFIETKRGAQIMFLLGLALPLPLILVIAIRHYTSLSQIAGIGLGLLAALAIVFVVDLFQRMFNTFRGDGSDKAAKQMFFPFDNWLSKKAEESRAVQRFFSGPSFGRLSKLLNRIGNRGGAGYFRRTTDGVVLNPGIVLAVSMFFAYLLIYLVGFYVWTGPFVQDGLPWDFGFRAITYFFVVVTLLCWLLSGIAFHLDCHRLPTLLIVLVFLSFADLRHTYDVRHLGPASDPNFATPADVLNAREAQPYVIFVTANGGGIQSSAWATEVLTRFDETCRAVDSRPDGCRNAIALLSGISGGSVGVMYFGGAYDGAKEFDPEKAARIREYSRRSSLVNVAGGLVFNDFVRNIPFASLIMANDRGKHLARGWAYNRNRIDCDVQKAQDPTKPCKMTDIGVLSSWRAGVKEGMRPAVIFNATALETGKRVLFSTADFHPINPGFSDWTTLQQVGGMDADLRVTEAVRLSAAFPYVSPAAKMYFPEEKENKGPFEPSLADGGYYDNYGLLSVKDFLDVAFQNGAWSKGRRPKVLIVQILGEKPIRDPVTGQDRPPTFDFMSWFDQIFAPLTALLRVRGTSQYERNDEAFAAIERMMDTRDLGKPERFVFEFPDDGKPVPLSWHLTGEQIAALEKAGVDTFSAAQEPCDKAEKPWPRLRCALADALGQQAK